jgi:hypothetical protein
VTILLETTGESKAVVIVGYFNILFLHQPGGCDKNYKICTRYLLNANPVLYHRPELASVMYKENIRKHIY